MEDAGALAATHLNRRESLTVFPAQELYLQMLPQPTVQTIMTHILGFSGLEP